MTGRTLLNTALAALIAVISVAAVAQTESLPSWNDGTGTNGSDSIDAPNYLDKIFFAFQSLLFGYSTDSE